MTKEGIKLANILQWQDWLVDKITERVAAHQQYEELDELKFRYGLNQTISNMWIFVLICMLAIYLGCFWEMTISLIAFNILRRKAFGLHSLKRTYCFLASVSLFVILPNTLRQVNINYSVILLLYACMIYAMVMCAPSDTERRPLVGKARREKLRKQSIMIVAIFFVIVSFAHFSSFEMLKTYITYGLIIETFSILPITYRLLGRKYGNYEKYENNYERD